jgi:hypothetical protein
VPQPPQPRRWVQARSGRFEGDLLRPAQLVLLSPAIPDTLILTELTS